VKQYGAFESHPCVYDEGEGWVLFDREDGWKKIHIAEIQQNARPMTKAQFEKDYGKLPALPKTAFS
jgi:hypothetical protein